MIIISAIFLTLGAPDAAAQQVSAPQKKERLVCRSEVKTGTRTSAPKRCMTSAQWKALAKGGGIDEAADTLGLIAEKINTGDVGGMQSGDSPR